jgi:hypothetical protein
MQAWIVMIVGQVLLRCNGERLSEVLHDHGVSS